MRHKWQRLLAAYVLAPAVGALACAFCFSMFVLIRDLLHGNEVGIGVLFRMWLLIAVLSGIFSYLGLAIAIPISVILMWARITHVAAYIALGLSTAMVIALPVFGKFEDLFKEDFWAFIFPTGFFAGLFYWWFYVRYMLKQQEAPA